MNSRSEKAKPIINCTVSIFIYLFFFAIGKTGLMAMSIKIVRKSTINRTKNTALKKTKFRQYPKSDKTKLFKDSL